MEYSSIEQIEQDIKDVKIQGATNVAIATFEGLKLFAKDYNGDNDVPIFLSEVERVGVRLSQARPNEPLAKNGLKFVMHMLRIENADLHDINEAKDKVGQLADEFLKFIEESKQKITQNGLELLGTDVNEVLTHCHSSTVEGLIIQHAKRVPGFKAVCTETRPLMQGRLTAKALVEGGVDTTMIVDSSAESYIIGRGSHEIDVIFTGCDEISMKGDAINKIGSWGVALAAYYASKPLYVVGSVLKTDVTTAYKPPEIEMREASEVWKEAPAGLKLVNPSFELINKEFITGYITELGVLKPDEIERAIQREYKWLF
ncbi:MAG: translation initiation factor eIF-2B [Candidatus Dojkabacteria bacterium]|nr:MAG: translation initiation factor eIF-2B [Candidatus Dojkabacteria bacterium]